MPRRSLVLEHPARTRIDAEIRAGRDRKAIARSHGLPYMSLYRYAAKLVDGRTTPSRRRDVSGPVATFTAAFGLEATPYQVALLTDSRSTIFLKGRQCGATQAAAALAIHVARSRIGADVVIISPSLTQSKEVTTRARAGLYRLEESLVQDASNLLRLRNASRIISLPGSARAVRGYSPALVIIDEAAWVEDDTYSATRPLLAASRGRFVAISTPGHQVGWFYELWESELGADWLRLELPATANPLIDPDFLAREQRELRPEVYAQEYLCRFGAGINPAIFPLDVYDELLTEAS
jgi:hypothetical protein